MEYNELDRENSPESPAAKDTKKAKKAKSEVGIFGQGLGLGILMGVLGCALAALIVASLIRFGVIRLVLKPTYPGNSTTSGSVPLNYLGDDVAKKMNTIQSIINKYYLYEYDQEDMVTAIYDAMMGSLKDPYSVYYTPQEYKDLMESTSGQYCGLGVVVQKNTGNDKIEVVNPYPNSPGEEAGLIPGDFIIAADGVVLTGMELDVAVTYIKGDEGSKVMLTIERDGKTFEVEATRRKIDIVTVDYKLREDGIGYLAVSQFDGVTVQQFKNAINDLSKQGMKGLVIDLRDNPGGRLDAVIDMLDYIMPAGPIVSVKDKNGNGETYSSDAKTALRVPCAILVNGNSASASEIFAGAMKDTNLGYLVGTKTFGKGIVQSILSMGDGSAVKITVQNYYTPNGTSIHGTGIEPHKTVEFDRELYNQGIDVQLDAAVEYLHTQTK